MHTLTEEEVGSLVKKSVDYGVSTWGKKDTMALQIARFWLDGYIVGSSFTDDDTNQIYKTFNSYCF